MGNLINKLTALFKKRFRGRDSRDALLLLRQDVEQLKKEVLLLRELLEGRCWHIDKFHVDRMEVEQFNINLESINVDQLGGALNVGITHSCPVGGGGPADPPDPPDQPGEKQGYSLTFRPRP
ncbi:hypothetical protein SAMN02745218_02213 [Desulfofundulus australicus DSM 11792]|uniref:Uncharacterized protein n=1 Tax=Desulfofundulus australicus DSM 11792 TaxID=1121425 RepID=A0A1M5BH90_9FIRM|nr:hypothetical protein [Desulfofundulus australicus]SHF41983.1 hypothetical protein SAMN02745218_02213 [Desulfofundulus australicus DSM 11792]